MDGYGSSRTFLHTHAHWLRTHTFSRLHTHTSLRFSFGIVMDHSLSSFTGSQFSGSLFLSFGSFVFSDIVFSGHSHIVFGSRWISLSRIVFTLCFPHSRCTGHRFMDRLRFCWISAFTHRAWIAPGSAPLSRCARIYGWFSWMDARMDHGRGSCVYLTLSLSFWLRMDRSLVAPHSLRFTSHTRWIACTRTGWFTGSSHSRTRSRARGCTRFHAFTRTHGYLTHLCGSVCTPGSCLVPLSAWILTGSVAVYSWICLDISHVAPGSGSRTLAPFSHSLHTHTLHAHSARTRLPHAIGHSHAHLPLSRSFTALTHLTRFALVYLVCHLTLSFTSPVTGSSGHVRFHWSSHSLVWVFVHGSFVHAWITYSHFHARLVRFLSVTYGLPGFTRTHYHTHTSALDHALLDLRLRIRMDLDHSLFWICGSSLASRITFIAPGCVTVCTHWITHVFVRLHLWITRSHVLHSRSFIRCTHLDRLRTGSRTRSLVYATAFSAARSYRITLALFTLSFASYAHLLWIAPRSLVCGSLALAPRCTLDHLDRISRLVYLICFFWFTLFWIITGSLTRLRTLTVPGCWMLRLHSHAFGLLFHLGSLSFHSWFTGFPRLLALDRFSGSPLTRSFTPPGCHRFAAPGSRAASFVTHTGLPVLTPLHVYTRLVTHTSPDCVLLVLDLVHCLLHSGSLHSRCAFIAVYSSHSSPLTFSAWFSFTLCGRFSSLDHLSLDHYSFSFAHKFFLSSASRLPRTCTPLCAHSRTRSVARIGLLVDQVAHLAWIRFSGWFMGSFRFVLFSRSVHLLPPS